MWWLVEASCCFCRCDVGMPMLRHGEQSIMESMTAYTRSYHFTRQHELNRYLQSCYDYCRAAILSLLPIPQPPQTRSVATSIANKLNELSRGQIRASILQSRPYPRRKISCQSIAKLRRPIGFPICSPIFTIGNTLHRQNVFLTNLCAGRWVVCRCLEKNFRS